MMYTFKCNAAGDVTMTQTDGEQMLHIIGKAPAAKGIIEVAAVPAAIQALENAVAREPAARRPAATGKATERGDPPNEEDEVVELHQRVWPLLEMLKRARDEREVIVWGV
jgi:hypothetical protein